MEERINGNNKYKLSKLRWQMNKQYWQPHFLLFSILSFPCSQHCLPYLSSPSFPPTPLEFLSQSSLSSPHLRLSSICRCQLSLSFLSIKTYLIICYLHLPSHHLIEALFSKLNHPDHYNFLPYSMALELLVCSQKFPTCPPCGTQHQ